MGRRGSPGKPDPATEDFERGLEQESRLGRALRPPAQLLMTRWLGGGNERVYPGRDRWAFYRPDVEYVTGPGFLDPAHQKRRIASAPEWTAPPQPDPRPALLQFKRDLDAYLAATPGAPNHTLAEIVAFNSTFVPPMKYGQAIAEAAAQIDISPGSADTLRYLDDRADDLAVSRDVLNGIYNGPDNIPGTADDTDAILALGNNFAGAPAKAGFPSVTVPGGFILADTNPPTNDPPINGPFPQTVTFSGPAFSEPRLIALAYAFEQATRYRVPPSSTPPLPSDSVGRR